jgi:hypothetical protein
VHQEKKRKDLEDEEALERIANTYKGKPLPDDWDPETHPLFMKDPDTQVCPHLWSCECVCCVCAIACGVCLDSDTYTVGCGDLQPPSMLEYS